MDDLINRQAVLKKMCEMCYYHTSQDFVCNKCNVYELLAEQPAVEAEPVQHGQWMQRRNLEYYCTNCGREERFIFQKYFCPRCGAKMDVIYTNDGGKGGVGSVGD